MKMPAESSIYWDSVGSQRSASGGSTGSAGRHYVDPWDLENYAYLRRHSVAGLTQQASRQHRRSAHRMSQESRAHSEYWYSLSTREPGYVAPAFVEELYCGPARPANNSCHYHQPIYEDEVPDYVAPFPVYSPLSEVRHGEFMEDHRRPRQRCKSTSMKDIRRSTYVDHMPPMGTVELDVPDHHSRREYRSLEQGKCVMHIVPPPHLDLNTYGHLKIDYTNSWNSLNRKISAPGCEPGMVSFSCDPQLEEELVSVIYSLELLFTKNRRAKEIDMEYEIGRCTDIKREMSLNINSDSNLRSVLSPKNRTPHSVHSCGYIGDFKKSDDDLSGYLTN